MSYLGAVFFYRHMKTQNKVDLNLAVVVIGCDSGLGYSLALHCRTLGFAVIASVLNMNDPNVEELSQTGIHVCELDIVDKQSVKNFGCVLREILNKENLGE